MESEFQEESLPATLSFFAKMNRKDGVPDVSGQAAGSDAVLF